METYGLHPVAYLTILFLVGFMIAQFGAWMNRLGFRRKLYNLFHGPGFRVTSTRYNNCGMPTAFKIAGAREGSKPELFDQVDVAEQLLKYIHGIDVKLTQKRDFSYPPNKNPYVWIELFDNT